MIRFLIRRIVFGVLVLWLVSTATFALFFVAPHDPARTIAGQHATAVQVEMVKHRLGLDQPLIVQYGHYLWRLLHGDLGQSFINNSSVTSIIGRDFPPTFSLVIGGAVLWIVVGLGVGVLSATRARSLLDRFATFFVLGGVSFPTFVVGLLLIYLFFFKFHQWGLPYALGGGAYIGFTSDPGGWFHRMLLPWITLAIVQAATYSRLTRGSLLDVLGEDYIRTARAKGLSERRVVYRHGLRAALTPVVTQFGVDFGYMLGGVVVTEQVFGLGGLGQELIGDVTTGDLPVIIGIVLLVATLIVIANIVVDVVYSLLDPRVRIG